MQSTQPSSAAKHGEQRLAGGCLLGGALPFVGIGILAFSLGPVGDGKPYALWLFATVFVLTGLAMMAGGVAVLRIASRDAKLRAAAPGQPWRWRKDWAQNRSDDPMGIGLMILWGFAVMWSLMSSFAFLPLPAALAEGQWIILLALIFPLVGVGLLSLASYHTIRALRFGRPVFELDTNPYVPGRSMSGTVRAKIRNVPDDGFDATLRQIRAITTGSGKGRSTREEVQWEQHARIARGAAAASSETARIPIRFELPEDAQETDDSNPNDRHLWRLEVKASLAGVDFEATFEVPVFRAGV